MHIKKQIHFNSHMGRMGNQMFQYACAQNLEHQHGFTCSLDDLTNLKYFELGTLAHLKNSLKSKFFFHIAKRIKGIQVHNLQFEDMIEDYSRWFLTLNKPTMVWGFFQSDQYFSESADLIKNHFRIKNQYQKGLHQFLSKNGLEKGAYNAIHIRRTDYKGFKVKGLKGDDFTLPLSYYQTIINSLDTSFPLVIVSDDPEFCKIEFGTKKNVLIAAESAIVDFQILSNAYDIAISNSTFAWWAAWLNPHQGKVFCPEYFLGFKENKEVPINIYPSNWIKTKVAN